MSAASQKNELAAAESLARAALAAGDTSTDGWQVLGWTFARVGKLGAAALR